MVCNVIICFTSNWHECIQIFLYFRCYCPFCLTWMRTHISLCRCYFPFCLAWMRTHISLFRYFCPFCLTWMRTHISLFRCYCPFCLIWMHAYIFLFQCYYCIHFSALSVCKISTSTSYVVVCFCVHSVKVRGDWLFVCWYWLNCWPSMFRLSFHNIFSAL